MVFPARFKGIDIIRLFLFLDESECLDADFGFFILESLTFFLNNLVEGLIF